MYEVETIKESSVPVAINSFIDKVESRMIQAANEGLLELKSTEATHRFTPGLYSRQFEMFPGELIVSKIHLTEHQFIISKGVIIVIENGEEILLVAPYHGITKPGTRRVLFVPKEAVESCIWTTFHANPDDLDEFEIEKKIIEPHTNPLLNDEERKLIS
jgi:hypothetical protein